jgi:hypothetical protein
MELRAFRALADPGGARAQVGRRFDDRTGRHLGTSLPGRPALGEADLGRASAEWCGSGHPPDVLP